MSCDVCSFPYSLCQCPGIDIPIGPVGSITHTYWDHVTNQVHRFWHLRVDEGPYTHWKPKTKEVFTIALDSPYKLRRIDLGMPYFEGLGYLHPISREGS